jgi:hypothetical protein
MKSIILTQRRIFKKYIYFTRLNFLCTIQMGIPYRFLFKILSSTDEMEFLLKFVDTK